MSTKGRYVTPAQKSTLLPPDRALYLSVQAKSREALDAAVKKINDILHEVVIHIERDRQTDRDRETERQRQRQTDRQTKRQRDRKTE